MLIYMFIYLEFLFSMIFFIYFEIVFI